MEQYIIWGMKNEMTRDRLVLVICDNLLGEKLQLDSSSTLETAKRLFISEKLYMNNKRISRAMISQQLIVDLMQYNTDNRAIVIIEDRDEITHESPNLMQAKDML